MVRDLVVDNKAGGAEAFRALGALAFVEADGAAADGSAGVAHAARRAHLAVVADAGAAASLADAPEHSVGANFGALARDAAGGLGAVDAECPTAATCRAA